MYTISDVVELGDARELILAEVKLESEVDDSEPNTFEPAEYFDR